MLVESTNEYQSLLQQQHEIPVMQPMHFQVWMLSVFIMHFKSIKTVAFN